MDRLAAMRVIVKAADAGSLSGAGRRLGLPLSTISRRVTDLETHLKAQIFLRGGRELVLTDAGRPYVEACRRILDDLDEAERAAAGEYSEPQGALAIAAPLVFGRLHVAPLLPAFLAAHPRVRARLDLGDRVVDFAEEHIDVAVRIGPLADSTNIARKIGQTRRVTFASPDYLARRGTIRRLDDLAAHDCITFSRLDAEDRWLYRDGAAAPVVSRLIVSTAETAIEAAIAGAGVARAFSYQIADAERAGDVVRVLEAHEPHPAPIHLVYPASGRLPKKVRAFVDFMAPRLQDRIVHA